VVPIYAHGEAPGNPTASSCPGRHIKAWLDAGRPSTPDNNTAAIRVELEAAQAAIARALVMLGDD